MSVKRQATTELNHDNWDQEDPSKNEEMGTFKAAPKDILEKRVIRTAKRRSMARVSNEGNTSLFSGFGGFNKTTPSSFDFLANLTHGSKNSSPSSNTDIPTSLGLFTSKLEANPSPQGLFGLPTSFELSTSATSFFGGSPNSSSDMKTKKHDISNLPLRVQTTTSNSNGSNSGNVVNSSNATAITSGSISDSENDKKIKYFSQLKGLNTSVSDWIKKHVDESPLCILSPIFIDYEKHLKEIQEEYHGCKNEVKEKTVEKDPIVETVKAKETSKPNSAFDSLKNNDSVLSTDPTKSSLFSNENEVGKGEKPSSFAFGINHPSSTSTSTTVTSSGFSFGINTATTGATTTSIFSFAPNTSTKTTVANGASTTPFSFGNGKPFSFNSNIQSQSEPSNKTEEEDEPPKAEFTSIIEENSIFDKHCKIFVKKDGEFVDNGVGTLYIKKIEEKEKYQLLVRANTNLGNVLVNLILASAIPTRRMGKNNVMMICIPTPNSKPPPTTLLIRVKTSEEADELLDTLNKYKT